MGPVNRGRPPRRNRAKELEWQQRSRENQRLDPSEREVREAVFARDGYRCQLRDFMREQRTLGARVVEVPLCYGGLTYHHRRKAGAQGAYTLANGATLCVEHNYWVEDEPEATKLVLPSLVVREADPEWEQLGRRAAKLAAE